MLSFIYSLIREYEAEHDLRPNVLYLNIDHFHRLRYEFVDPDDLEGIMNCLGMEIIIDKTAIHPHLGNIGQSLRVSAVS